MVFGCDVEEGIVKLNKKGLIVVAKFWGLFVASILVINMLVFVISKLFGLNMLDSFIVVATLSFAATIIGVITLTIYKDGSNEN